MHGIEGAETTPQECTDEFSIDGRVIPREMDVFQRAETFFQILLQPADLGRFPSPIQAFDDKQHGVSSLLWDTKIVKKTEQCISIICNFEAGFERIQ